MFLVQRESKYIIRESLRDALCECDKMYVCSGETQIHYDFLLLFEGVMSQHGAQFQIQDVNLYDHILFEPGEYMDTEYAYNNVLTQLCIRGEQLQRMYMDRDPQVYQNELLMQFMAFVMSFNLQIAVQIIKTHFSCIQYMIMKDGFDVKYMETLLTWDETLLEALLYWKDVNDTHSSFSLPFTLSKSGHALRKLNMVVSVLDYGNPKWTSLEDLTLHAHNNFVKNRTF